MRAWLWTEDAIVLLDLLGSDLKAILAEDRKRDLVTNGLDREALTIQGRSIDGAAYYRVATTDLLFEGARFRAFENAKRIKRTFRIGSDGSIRPSRSGETLPLRAWVLGELKRLRSGGTGEGYDETLAALLDKDPPFEPLLSFSFDHPTLFTSFSEAVNNAAYGAVQDSRVTSGDTVVVGVTGRYVLTHDRRRLGLDLGTTASYSKQSADDASGATVVTESADDLRFELTARRKPPTPESRRPQPFLTGSFSTEFSPSLNPTTGVKNPRRKLLRGVGGLMLPPREHWPHVQLGLVVEDDLALDNVETGLELKAEYTRKLGPLANIEYRFRNGATYFLPSDKDDTTDLGLSYNMVHEVLIPFAGELSLSVAADLLFYRGKLPVTSKLGTNAILRVGITYNRLWKPRYQPFF